MLSIAIPDIIEATAAFFGTTPIELTGPVRTSIVSQRRAVAFHLAKELTDEPVIAIGRAFGGRDHTTVTRAVSRPLPSEYTNAIDMIRAQLVTETEHAKLVVRRWQFKSRRKPIVPTFFRRHTVRNLEERPYGMRNL